MSDQQPVAYCNNARHPYGTPSEASSCDLEAHRKHVAALQAENERLMQERQREQKK